jgi:hypothetical protein
VAGIEVNGIQGMIEEEILGVVEEKEQDAAEAEVEPERHNFNILFKSNKFYKTSHFCYI